MASKDIINEKVNAIIEDALEHDRFSLFMSHDFQRILNDPNMPLESLEYFFDLYTQWDEQCKLPNDFGVYLDDLTKDKTMIVGVRRIRLDNMDSLVEIMKNGSTNHGHLNNVGGGNVLDAPEIALSFTPLEGNITGYINLVASYNDNNVVLYAAFPRTMVDEELYFRDESYSDIIYDKSGSKPIIKPEYLIGATIKNSDGLDTFLTKDEIINSKDK